jgi:hypothetical protein
VKTGFLECEEFREDRKRAFEFPELADGNRLSYLSGAV